RVSFHVQQTTLGVYLFGLGGFFYALAAGLLPVRFYRNNDRKTDAPPLLRFCMWSFRSLLIHCEEPPLNRFKPPYTTLLIALCRDAFGSPVAESQAQDHLLP